jgi:5-methyltetrahydrofolate--homocysteine methyltransferase
MIVIGERINSTRKSINIAIGNRDMEFLVQEANSQLNAGSDFLDINCATALDKEVEVLKWVISGLQQRLGCSICVDSPNQESIKSAISVVKGTLFINSITAEEKKLKALEAFNRYNGSRNNIISLCIDENGMADDVENRIRLAKKILDHAQKNAIDPEHIYIDPLAKPLSTEPDQALFFLETVKELKKMGIKTVGGLSNVSFGLPKRGIINAVFLKMALESGIDAVIVDPTSPYIKMVLEGKDIPKNQHDLARSVITAEDSFAMNYITAFREGRL